MKQKEGCLLSGNDHVVLCSLLRYIFQRYINLIDSLKIIRLLIVCVKTDFVAEERVPDENANKTVCN